MKDRNWIVVKLRRKYQFLARLRCKLLELSMWLLGFDCKFKGFFIPKEQPKPPKMWSCRSQIVVMKKPKILVHPKHAEDIVKNIDEDFFEGECSYEIMPENPIKVDPVIYGACPECGKQTLKHKGIFKGGGVECVNPDCPYSFLLLGKKRK